jgi:hypothetical protein
VNNVAVNALTTRATSNGTQLLATVSNHGDAPVEAALKLTVDDAPAGEQLLTIPADGDVRASFVVPVGDGIATVRLEHGDALAADNVRMAVLTRTPRIRVRVTGPNARSYFLVNALAANENVELVSDPDGTSDVVACVGCPELPPGRSGVLWFPPFQFDGSPAPLVRTEPGHPIAAGLPVDGTTAQLLRAAPPAAGSTVIARAAGQPAILAYESTSRIVEVRIDPAGEPFALSTAFPVLIANALEWLAVPGRDSRTVIAGEPLRLVSNAAGDPAQVMGPDGRSVRSTLHNGLVTVADTNAAGLYRFQGRTVVVNPAAGPESDLRTRPAPAALEAGSSQAGNLRPLDLTPALLVAALLLLGIEWHYRTA